MKIVERKITAVAVNLIFFSSGKLLADPSRPNGPTFVGLSGEFFPALSLYGTNVKLTVHTGEAYDN